MSMLFAPLPPTSDSTYFQGAWSRKCLEQSNADLRDRLQDAQPFTSDLQGALDQQRRVINDIHKRVVAVTKGLQKHAS